MLIKLKFDKISGIGKNNFGVSRNGIHYPKKQFIKFRNACIAQILTQRPLKSFISPVCMKVVYNPPDNRKRDATAILDALFHILEYSGILKDDSLVVRVEYTKINDKNSDYTFLLQLTEISEKQ